MKLLENVKLHIWLAFVTHFSFLLDTAELEFHTLIETLRPMISTPPLPGSLLEMQTLLLSQTYRIIIFILIRFPVNSFS